MTGRVVEIKRFAVHDGPGIRTTLFLKGCPLSCRWCHNPETISPEPEIGWLARKCIGCARCAEVCPAGAHVLRDGNHRLDRKKCVACGECVEACLPGALELYGRDMTVEEAVSSVLADRTFYEESGGGCTVSGGEPLLQAGFCAQLCERLRDSGVHCAIDTAGAVSWDKFEVVLPFADLFLYDVKHVLEAPHLEQTGVPCRSIMENLERLVARPVATEVRVPVIPGFNDELEHVTAVAEFLAGLQRRLPVRLVSYHSMARSKYEAIGRADTLPEVESPSGAALAGIAAVFRSAGVSDVLLPPNV